MVSIYRIAYKIIRISTISAVDSCFKKRCFGPIFVWLTGEEANKICSGELISDSWVRYGLKK